MIENYTKVKDKKRAIKYILYLITSIYCINIALKENLIYGLIILGELILLISLIFEDIGEMEISANRLIILLILTPLKILFKNKPVNYKVFIFANILYFTIFIISKKNFGFGDVILNSILSLNFSSIYLYFSFFTLTFVLGSIFCTLMIIIGNRGLKTKIPFVPFIVLAYLLLLGGNFV